MPAPAPTDKGWVLPFWRFSGKKRPGRRTLEPHTPHNVPKPKRVFVPTQQPIVQRGSSLFVSRPNPSRRRRKLWNTLACSQNFMLEISPKPDKDYTSLYHKLHHQCLQKKPMGEKDKRVRRAKTRNRGHQCASKIGKTFATSREKKEKKEILCC